MPLSEIYEFFTGYDRESFAAFSQQGAEPDGSVIDAFEAQIGFALPAEFREFASHPLGGLYLEVKEHLWPRAEASAVGPFWSFLYGLQVYGLSAETPEWLDMRQAWEEMSEDGSPELVPFLRIVGDADPYCFTRDGGIVIWRHEEPDDPEMVAATFSECLMKEIRELEERLSRKIAGEG